MQFGEDDAMMAPIHFLSIVLILMGVVFSLPRDPGGKSIFHFSV